MKNSFLTCSLISILSSAISLTAYAGDPEAGKIKARNCAGCHGLDGIGIGSEFPNLAGQKQAYLVKQLNAFKSGARVNPSMKTMAASLTNHDIENLAAYYASLTQPATTQSVAASPANQKATSVEFPETVHISMKKSGTIETFPAKKVWPGGPNMLYTAITPDGKKLLSTSPSGNSVYIFDTATGKQLAIVAVGKAPKGVKVTPNGNFAYISNQGSADISIVDLKRLKNIASIKVKEGPHNVRFTRNGKLAYVTLQGGAGIAVINTAQRKMLRVIPVPGITGPHNLDLSNDEQTAYVRDFVHHVAVLDLKKGTVTKVIKVGSGHGGIDVSPDGKYIATTAIADNFISIIDAKTLAVKNIPVGNGSHGIRASADSRWIYVTLTKQNQVAVIDTSTMQVTKKIPTGKFPFWISVQNNP